MSYSLTDITVHSPSDLGALLNENFRGAGLFYVRKAKTALFTIWTDDVDGSPVARYACTGTFAATLVAATETDAAAGRIVTITSLSGTTTITPDGSDTVNGAATLAVTAGNSTTIQSDGVSNWEVI